jgi:hypothetical protein
VFCLTFKSIMSMESSGMGGHTMELLLAADFGWYVRPRRAGDRRGLAKGDGTGRTVLASAGKVNNELSRLGVRCNLKAAVFMVYTVGATKIRSPLLSGALLLGKPKEQQLLHS